MFYLKNKICIVFVGILNGRKVYLNLFNGQGRRHLVGVIEPFLKDIFMFIRYRGGANMTSHSVVKIYK